MSFTAVATKNSAKLSSILLLLMFFYAVQILGKSPKIMTYEEYASTSHTVPYLFKKTRYTQHLFYFGADHSCDSAHPQFTLLENFWQDFLKVCGNEHCVVLVEGSLRPLRSTAQEAIRSSGEGSYITFLASAHSILVECPEPESSSQINALLQEFTQEEVLYAFGAQAALSGIRESKIRNFFSHELFIEDALNKRFGKHFQLPLTIKTLQNIHQKLFEDEFDFHDEHFFYTITNPVRNDSVINRVCRKNSILRDVHIVNYIENLLRTGKNVFVVYGSSHAVMQEGSLRSICT